ncbi:GGDEF domain-containing protein [Hansschlegelia quercus]|uniref:diguanylate cyclase n=1 Tax=Hansschlegelia quercus TaxID=2528245 RepID=A0A4Q9GNQ4_9HYPH|nr:GGDEF domain-containing protein [Hansschlegelia quercus]TBN55141.1 GGDEF domain-containing protein [Hansschlegelia quercus]
MLKADKAMTPPLAPTLLDADRTSDDAASFAALIACPIVLIDLAATPRAWLNPSACALFGNAYQSEGYAPLTSVVGEEASMALAAFGRDLPANGVGARISLDCHAAGGPLRLRFELARRGSDQIVATVRAEDGDVSSADELSRLYAALQALPVGVELFDADFNALFYNRKSDELFDYEASAVPNHDDWWILAFPEAAARREAFEQWRRTIAAARLDPSRSHLAEWTVTCRDGAVRTIQFFYRFLGDRYLLVLWDVTEQRRLEAELRATASTDSLTGLFNRRAFVERADAAVAASRSTQAPLSVLMIDIDHFKAINDRFGHAVGDQVLKTVAQRASEGLRREDVFARLGGEEFAVLLPGADRAQATMIASRLHAAISNAPMTVNGHTIGVTVSVGGAMLRGSDLDADVLVDRADGGLYAAKANGRNRIEFEEAA